MAVTRKRSRGQVANSDRPPTNEPAEERALKPKTRWRLRWESETQKHAALPNVVGTRSRTRQIVAETGEPSGANRDNNDAPSTFESEEETKRQHRGVNFYKRIGYWTANIWDTTSSKSKQLSLGSYYTVTEAASAYDKAYLKLHGTTINNDKSEYTEDIEEMSVMEKMTYIDTLRSRAEASEPNYAGEGITICPRGWYEVKIRRDETPPPEAPPETPPKKIWCFLGRYLDLERAKRCRAAALQDSLDP